MYIQVVAIFINSRGRSRSCVYALRAWKEYVGAKSEFHHNKHGGWARKFRKARGCKSFYRFNGQHNRQTQVDLSSGL